MIISALREQDREHFAYDAKTSGVAPATDSGADLLDRCFGTIAARSRGR